MKKIFFSLILSSFLLLPAIGLATGDIGDAPEVPLIIGIGRIVNIIFTILMAAAVLFVMIGAFQFITAGGDTEKVTAAREKILYAVIAVVVALLSWGIIDLIRRGIYPGV